MSALQQYTDIKIICDAVEKAAIKRARRGHRTSAKVAGLNSLLSVDQLLHGSQLALESMKKPVGGSPSTARGTQRDTRDTRDTRPERDTRDDTRPTRPGRDEDTASAERWTFCPPDYPGDDWDISGPTPEIEFGFSYNPFDAADADTDQAIRDLLGLEPGEDLAEGFENCFGCDLRLQFDFQLQPINLLLELDNLFDQISDILDFWREYADPLNFLARICDFLDWWGDLSLCKQDLIAMLLALQALLAKYANLAISISLDWTLLFGPLLKFILDALSQLIEQVIQLISAPIDCIIGFLKTIDEIVNAVVDTANVAAAFGQTMAGTGGDTPVGQTGEDGFLNLAGLGNYSAEGTKKELEWEGGAGSGGLDFRPNVEGKGEQGFVPRMEKEDTEWFSGNPYASTANTSPPELNASSGSLGGGLQNEKGDSKVEIPTGFNLAGKNGLEEALKDPKFKFSSPMQKLILSLEEAKKWITSLFANILFSLKSLSALVGGGIGLNLQNIGFLMMILDIINLIKLLASLQGVNPCSDNIDKIEEFLKRYVDGDVQRIQGEDAFVVSSGAYTREISFAGQDDGCSTFSGVRDTSQETYEQNKKDS